MVELGVDRQDADLSRVSTDEQQFRQSDRKTLRHDAYHAIREAIAAGRLKPGDRILETNIAAQMGISVGPVREAVRKLEEEGLILSFPRRGSFVARIGPEDVEEVLDLRAVLEVHAVRLVMAQGRIPDLDRLHGIALRMLDAAEADDVSLYEELNIQFHRTLCALAGRKRLLRLWSILSDQWHILTTAEWRTARFPSQKRDARQHQEIVEAMQAGDVAAAVACVERHVASAKRDILSSLPSLIGEESSKVRVPF